MRGKTSSFLDAGANAWVQCGPWKMAVFTRSRIVEDVLVELVHSPAGWPRPHRRRARGDGWHW